MLRAIVCHRKLSFRQVLFVSANLTGNHTLVDIATSHADKTMVNHLRPDGMPPQTETRLEMLKPTSIQVHRSM